MTSIRTRFAPSPTGLLHAGNYRTALFCYLYAKKHHGEFTLRIEDTDTARSTVAYRENIIEALEWLGLSYSTYVIQSEQTHLHQAAIQRLIDTGHAYISQEEIKKEGDRPEVIRFKNPNKKVVFTDMIRGTIETDTTDLGDFVIARSMTEPVFHLAVVVDDASMGITLVIRGEDHISNTPRHILIQEALGYETPAYAHLPLVLAPDRTKLSKRKGAKTITDYKHSGFLQSAVINYMALIGWNPGTEKEIFTFDELIGAFDISKVQKGGAIFDETKLEWINREHLNLLSADEFRSAFETYIQSYLPKEHIDILNSVGLDKVIAIARERLMYFGQIREMLTSGDLEFLFAAPTFDTHTRALLLPNERMWKNGQGENISCTLDTTKALLSQVITILTDLDETLWTKEGIKEALWSFASHEGRGLVLWPMRVALSGKEKSPDPFVIAETLGKHDTLVRLTSAVKIL